MKIVTFITPEYENIVKPLIESAAKFMLDLVVERVGSRGTWEKNTGIKPEVVLRHLEEGEPFIITDADSVFKQDIDEEIFENSYLSIRYKGGVELLSGTMFFRPAKHIQFLAEEWLRRVPTDYKTPEQQHLADAILETNTEIKLLPDTYCAIFDETPNIDNPVIVHHQASRKMRNGINGKVKIHD